MTTEIYSTLKQGKTSTTYTLQFIAGDWHLGQSSDNGYTRFNACQWGSEDTLRIVKELGLTIPAGVK